MHTAQAAPISDVEALLEEDRQHAEAMDTAERGPSGTLDGMQAAEEQAQPRLTEQQIQEIRQRKEQRQAQVRWLAVAGRDGARQGVGLTAWGEEVHSTVEGAQLLAPWSTGLCAAWLWLLHVMVGSF